MLLFFTTTDLYATTPLKPGHFSRLSNFWLTTGGITQTEHEDGHAKLVRAGYLRQVGFPSLAVKGRLQGIAFVNLISSTVATDQQIRGLWPRSRKYRDEIRPRHGVLRSKEFVMKDLYTFDYSLQSALKTYEEARVAYNRLFDELKLPYLVAEASSGDIGGDLSHEYHLPSSIGEDNVISCTDCSYVANEELAAARPIPLQDTSFGGNGDVKSSTAAHVWRGISKDRKTLVNVWYPTSFKNADINPHALKSVFPSLDSSLEDALPLWDSVLSSSSSIDQQPQLLNIVDYRLGQQFADGLENEPDRFPMLPPQAPIESSQLNKQYVSSSTTGEPFNTIRIHEGDYCPRCTSGKLKIQKAIELGHTFHLGTKYSEALNARVQMPLAMIEDGQVVSTNSDSMGSVAMQMGCHGIGVSRIIGAVAEHLADERGLNWPRAIAPFEVVVIPGKNMEEDAATVSHSLIGTSGAFTPIDLVLDDRAESFPWKLKDADLVGYPVIVILGRKWTSDRLCEVQCRRLGSVEFVSSENLQEHINKLLTQL
ncbi:hypothetical protein FHL15_000045 [Xylaria flabelliformis]|uniref:Aminoacyl-transfer RNA synthetases class-II family profile domain-containing protein n=1 Tax=Xylaria flabelliformis TaxID=2512241 RepID=A0A553IER1_9PEZI|nr:hypothetical protein FHL15_000045 [Xylaria flabelliformis]